MDKKDRIVLLTLLGAAVAIGSAVQLKRRAKGREQSPEGVVYIGRNRSDSPNVTPDPVEIYGSTPVVFLSAPDNPELDWVVTITDAKGTPFTHGNGKRQAVFTPTNNVSEVTAKRPSPGKKDVYKYTVTLPHFGTDQDPQLIVH